MDLARQLCFNILIKAHTKKTQTKSFVNKVVTSLIIHKSYDQSIGSI